MKIGITCYPTFGGSGIVATELGMGLAKRGHEVHFITYAQPSRLLHFEEGVYYHEVVVPNYPLFEYAPYALALAAKMAEVAKYQSLDILHVHYAIPHAISAYLAKQILAQHPIKVVTTLHGTDITLVGNDPSYMSITKFGIEVSDGVTAVSQFLLRETEKTFQIARPIEVIYNFIDTEVFRRSDQHELRSRLCPNNEKLICHITNFRPVKQIEHVIRMFHQVAGELDARLVLVGDGPDRTRAEQLCRELGVCDRILFLGKQDSITEVLSISDLFVLASKSESFGLAALEAMSCNVPVVAYNVGGLPEVITPDCGDLVLADDIAAMAASAVAILRDEEKQRTMGAAGRRRCEEVFNSTILLPQYEAYYQRILDGEN